MKKNLICSICEEEKSSTDFGRYQRRCNSCQDLQRCVRCKEIKPLSDFNSDRNRRPSGYSNKCKKCAYIIRITQRKNRTLRGEKGWPTKKLTYSRKIRQMFRDYLKRLNKSEINIGRFKFSEEEFKSKFPIINPGMQIDHCIPLSWFKEGTPISISCHLDNLQLTTKEYNSSKSNKWFDIPASKSYLELAYPYIKNTEFFNNLEK